MDVQAYYNASTQDWQFSLLISQEELDQFLADKEETVQELQSAIDNATMSALGY